MEADTSYLGYFVENNDEKDNSKVEMESQSSECHDQQQFALKSMMAATKNALSIENSLDAGPSNPHRDDSDDNDDDDEDDNTIYENEDDGDDDIIYENESLNDVSMSDDFDDILNNSSQSVGESDQQGDHLKSEHISSGKPFSATPQDNSKKSLVSLAADVYTPSKTSIKAFQIELSNLPNFLVEKQFNKFLASTLKFKPIKVKLVPKARIALVTFRNENQRQIAVATFDKKKWKKKRIKARVADASIDPASKAFKHMLRQEALDMARQKFIQAMAVDIPSKPDNQLVSHEDVVKRLNFAITPLWNIPYPEQLTIKQNIIVDTLQRLTDLLLQIPELKMNSWLSREIREGGGICCELAKCVPSPVIDGYRNNCDYSVSEGISNEKTVGFKLGFRKEEFSGVVEPTFCVHISKEAKTIAKHFQNYVRQSHFEVFNLKTLQSGYWQHLSVRTTDYGEKMAIVQLHPQLLSKAQLEDLYQDIKRFFFEGEGKECNLTSLYAIANSSKSTSIVSPSKKAPLTLIHGSSIIHEKINGVKLRISPKSYFQVNTKAAEKMIDVMREWMGDCANSFLLDICCGSGTIGLCLAQYVSKVIGIDSQQNLIADAEENAKINDIKNSVFIGGKVEHILTNEVFNHLPKKVPVIGIADPPRSGLQSKVIEALRRCEGMEKLIFVACNTNTAYTNFADLCRPSPPDKKTTKAFRLVKAVPVDFFPHSHHCALLLFFERDNTPSDTYRFFKFFY